MAAPEKNIPTILTVYGATGDLMRLKVIPALFNLYQKGELPKMMRVVGFARRPWSDAEFQEYVATILAERGTGATPEETVRAFLDLFRFQEGTFEQAESYVALKQKFNALDTEWGVCANKLFYLAVPPEYFELISNHLLESGLTEPCSPEEGWTRVLVEKPFGKNAGTAQQLDTVLGKLFKEEQIYRIDHYPAKEMLQNILTLRFANSLFEFSWGKQLIEKIHIRLLESLGVEKRGAFYDGVGALRDVGQNHLLQMLALLTMERPARFDTESIRTERGEILKKLILPTQEMIARTRRAQYEGYREIKGVAPESETETYFRVEASLDHPRWQGVPITMEGGKRLGESLKEIVITFNHPEPCLCPPGIHHRNGIVIRMEPKEEILIEFWSKKPGLAMQTEPRTFHFLLREETARVQYTEEYERLVLDAIRGDQTLFLSTSEVAAMWRYIDPILDAWKAGKVPLETYAPDTRTITE